jgi:hypothetical protein
VKISEAHVTAGMDEMGAVGNGHVDFHHFWRWYVTKHAEAGEHSAILQMVEEEMETQVPWASTDWLH